MALVLKHMTCTWGLGSRKQTIVEDLSLRLEQGELVALVGRKRSGKTTALNAIAGLSGLSSGTIQIDGKPMSKLWLFRGARTRARSIGLVTKEPLLIPEMTVLENVMLPLHHRFMSGKKKQARAKEVLRAVGLKGKGRFYPRELTAFEQQLVCTARAMVHTPQYLLFDEPTACLDGNQAERYMELLEVLASANYGILVATYSKRVASHCMRIVPISGEPAVDAAATAIDTSSQQEAEPGHTLAGGQEEADAGFVGRIGDGIPTKVEMESILEQQKASHELEEQKRREAYEKDEMGVFSAEEQDLLWEQKLSENISDFLKED